MEFTRNPLRIHWESLQYRLIGSLCWVVLLDKKRNALHLVQGIAPLDSRGMIFPMVSKGTSLHTFNGELFFGVREWICSTKAHYC